MTQRAALDELWNEDGVFHDPSKDAFRGRDEIDRIAGAIKANVGSIHADFTSLESNSTGGGSTQWATNSGTELARGTRSSVS